MGCSCSSKKRRGVSRRSVTFSQKSIERNIPTAVGGGAAILANPFVSSTIDGIESITSAAGKNGLKAIVKGGVGLLALSSGNQYADGFGTVMAAFGVAHAVDGVMQFAGAEPIFKISRRGIAGVNYGVLGGGNGYMNPVPQAQAARQGGLRR